MEANTKSTKPKVSISKENVVKLCLVGVIYIPSLVDSKPSFMLAFNEERLFDVKLKSLLCSSCLITWLQMYAIV